MVRPLDMQVNFHAVPEFARMTAENQAAMVYRFVHNLVDAKDETIRRGERVSNTEEQKESGLKPDGQTLPQLLSYMRNRQEPVEISTLYGRNGRDEKNQRFLFPRAADEAARGRRIDLIA